MRLSLDVSSLHAALGNMESRIDDAIRASAQAGAQVFYNEAQSRAPAASGRLQDAIYQKFIPELSKDGVRATYKVSWRTGRGKVGSDGTYLQTAPHGHLLEFGWIQRYQVYYNKLDEFKTMVRPDAKGKKKPGKFASQATKDAYYVLRKGGPVQWLPKSFIRSAYEAKQGAAAEAMKTKLIQELTQ